MPTRMHEEEVLVDADLVRRLVSGRFPQWADLPVTPVPSSGTDNAMFRLGTDLVVRLPRIGWAAGGVQHEQRWLPLVGRRLGVQVPRPVAGGEPAEGYPWSWGVYTWLEGTNPVVGGLADPEGLARQLALLVTQLRLIDLPDGPAAGRPVPQRDPHVRAALDRLDGLVDTTPLRGFWREATDLPPWEGAGVWMHGDLAPGNLLVQGSTLTGLIDFSGVGVGDPAGDLAVGWNLLPPRGREVLRSELAVDDATWARATAYAFGQALVQLPYYRRTNQVLAGSARHVLKQILAARDVAWTDDLGGTA